MLEKIGMKVILVCGIICMVSATTGSVWLVADGIRGSIIANREEKRRKKAMKHNIEMTNKVLEDMLKGENSDGRDSE